MKGGKDKAQTILHNAFQSAFGNNKAPDRNSVMTIEVMFRPSPPFPLSSHVSSVSPSVSSHVQMSQLSPRQVEETVRVENTVFVPQTRKRDHRPRRAVSSNNRKRRDVEPEGEDAYDAFTAVKVGQFYS